MGIRTGRNRNEHAEFLQTKTGMRRRMREGIFSVGLVGTALMLLTPQVFMLGSHLVYGPQTDPAEPRVSRRFLLGTEAYTATCIKTGYPPEDGLLGGGLIKCKALDTGGVLLYILGVLYMFFALAIVCDEHFVPALEVLVERWGIDDDVAGATFMAAGGSAPELFTSLIGTFTESSVGFGTIVGSAVFNVLFVIGVCAVASLTLLRLEWWPLFRDCTYYSFGLGLLSLFFGVITPQKIEWWEALILLLAYLGYVILMKFHVNVYKFICRNLGIPEKDVPKYEFMQHGILSLLKDELDLSIEAHLVLSLGAGSQVSKFDMLDGDKDGKIDSKELYEELMKDPVFARNPTSNDILKKMIASADTDGDGKIDKQEFAAWYNKAKNKIDNAVTKIFQELEIDDNGKIEQVEAELMMKKGNPGMSDEQISVSWKNLEKITDEDAKEYINVEIFQSWYQTQVLTKTKRESMGVLDEGEDDGVPKTLRGKILYAINYPIIFTLKLTLPDVSTEAGAKWAGFSFIGSIMWIGVYSYFMVWWATVAGDVIGIPVEVMGLTFLAAGTSVPDLLSSVIVAQRGKGDMAVSSSVGSNIFDILFGLPFPWLLYSLYYYITDGTLRENNVQASALIYDVLILLGMVGYVIVSVILSGWTMSKSLGMSYFFMYGVFVAQKLVRVYGFDEE